MNQAEQILQGLGGGENIRELEACITRLRVEVGDTAKVDEPGLREAGAFGIVIQGSTVQVVIGPTADTVAEDIQALR